MFSKVYNKDLNFISNIFIYDSVSDFIVNKFINAFNRDKQELQGRVLFSRIKFSCRNIFSTCTCHICLRYKNMHIGVYIKL